MNVRAHLKSKAELVPLFAFTGFGLCMGAAYLLRLATKGPEVTWSRARNPEPWQVIDEKKNIKLLSVSHDHSTFTRGGPKEAHDAVKDYQKYYKK